MAWLSDRFRIRWAVLIFQALTAITGLLIILYASAAGLRYFGLFLATFGAQSNIPATLAYGQNQTSRQEVKGVTAAAMISMGTFGGLGKPYPPTRLLLFECSLTEACRCIRRYLWELDI